MAITCVLWQQKVSSSARTIAGHLWQYTYLAQDHRCTSVDSAKGPGQESPAFWKQYRQNDDKGNGRTYAGQELLMLNQAPQKAEFKREIERFIPALFGNEPVAPEGHDEHSGQPDGPVNKY
jgi:hypothetical protein